MNKPVRDLLKAVYAQSVDIESSRTISGGCINQTWALNLSNGETVFLKHNDLPPDGMFEKEARGLNLMRQAENGPRTPKVIALPEGPNPHFLIIEYIEQGNPGNGYYERFAESLATMHRTTRDHYGLDHKQLHRFHGTSQYAGNGRSGIFSRTPPAVSTATGTRTRSSSGNY